MWAAATTVSPAVRRCGDSCLSNNLSGVSRQFFQPPGRVVAGNDEASCRIEGDSDQSGAAQHQLRRRCRFQFHSKQPACARQRLDDVEGAVGAKASPCGRPKPDQDFSTFPSSDTRYTWSRAVSVGAVTYKLPSGPIARWNAATDAAATRSSRPYRQAGLGRSCRAVAHQQSAVRCERQAERDADVGHRRLVVPRSRPPCRRHLRSGWTRRSARWGRTPSPSGSPAPSPATRAAVAVDAEHRDRHLLAARAAIGDVEAPVHQRPGCPPGAGPRRRRGRPEDAPPHQRRRLERHRPADNPGGIVTVSRELRAALTRAGTSPMRTSGRTGPAMSKPSPSTRMRPPAVAAEGVTGVTRGTGGEGTTE